MKENDQNVLLLQRLMDRIMHNKFILSTTITSSMTFMNSFNLIQYSFSPKVAEYIREQSCFTGSLGWIITNVWDILVVRKGYSVINGEEIERLFLLKNRKNILIGVTYLSPLSIVAQQSGLRVNLKDWNFLIVLFCISVTSVGVGLLINSSYIISISTVLFVVAIFGIFVMVYSNLINAIIQKLKMIIHSRDY